MRLSRLKLTAIGAGAALLAGIGISGGVYAAVSPPSTGDTTIHVGDEPTTTPVSAPQHAPAVPTLVTLPTGEQATVDGTTVTPANVTASPLVTFTWRGDSYAIPSEAIPEVGSTFDIRLFDVTYLAQVGGSAPVTVATNGAGAALAAGPTTLTKKNADKLTADKLKGIKHIALADKPGGPTAPTAPPTAAPAQQAGGPAYDTLTVDTQDRTGAAGEAVLIVQNIDDLSLASIISASDGESSFSVPAGTYSVTAAIRTPDGKGGFTTALVTKPQLDVGKDTSVSLDAGTAVPYQPSVDSVGQPAYRMDAIATTRTSLKGGSYLPPAVNPLLLLVLQFGLVSLTPNLAPGFFASQLYAGPSATVTKGQLDFDADTAFEDVYGETGVSTKPWYVLDFSHPGRIPDSLSQQVQSDQLTTLHNDVYQGGSVASDSRLYSEIQVHQPWGFSNEFGPRVSPGARTDYWYAESPDTRLDIRFVQNDASDGLRGQALDSRLYAPRPGGEINNVWNRGPQVPGPAGVPVNAESYDATKWCQACRQDDNLMLVIDPATDSDPAHFTRFPAGDYFAATSNVKFSRDGEPVLGATIGVGQTPDDLLVPLVDRPARYELDWATTWKDGLPGGVDTAWTFGSAPDPTAHRPAGQRCMPDPDGPCTPLSLLFPGFDLPVDHENQMAAGQPATIGFTINVQHGAPAPQGLTATVEVSFDDGKTWSAPQDAARGQDGEFHTTIQHPSADGYVSLRVSAHDSAGDTVRQTITRAYQITGEA